MEAFSYQHHHPFLIDPVFTPNVKIMPGFLEEPNNTSPFFSQFYPPESLQQVPLDVLLHKNGTLSTNEPSVVTNHKHNSTESSSVVDKPEIGEQVTQKNKVTSMEKRKRKNRDGSSLSSAQSKDARGVRGKNQKKCFGLRKDDEEEIKKANKAYNVNKKKDKEEVVLNHEQVPTGYIHVRARRGQATDSHSLAERVRREKISERMKLLQALVPGCDKVTGKALMLDEIINYVQSLQNQVEFLSMKLATVNPMLYDFGMDLDALMVTSERLNGLVSPLPNVQQIVPNNYPLLDSSSSFVFQEGQRPITLSQDNGQLLWDVDEQRRQSQLINQSGFGNNLCSFH